MPDTYNPEQFAQVVGLLDGLTTAERATLTERMVATGRDMLTIHPDELAEWIDQLGAVASQQAPDAPEESDWTDLEEFLDDTLLLSYKGSQYRLQAADIDTGLECQMLLGVGVKLRAGGTMSARQREKLSDAEESELYVRLLGGRQWLREPDEEECPACAAPAGEPCTEALGAECAECGAEPGALCTDDDGVRTNAHPGRGVLDGSNGYEFHGERGTRDPHYRPEHDVWQQLHKDGRTWAFVQHIGTTAIFWAALGTETALDFYKTGGRAPKAAPAPPALKVPTDHRPASTAANKTRTPASSSSSPRKRTAKKAPGGKRS